MAIFAAAIAPACAPDQQFADLGDFQLENGTTIRNCRIGYRTFGRLDAEKSNAILFPTWAMGTSRDLAKQIGSGKLVDSSRYFVIAVDALGNGVSSSPSNSAAQPGDAFPTFSVRDLAETEYALATRVFGVRRLKAVVGVSLGGMLAFAWATAHPDFAEKIVSVVGTPRASPGDRQRWEASIDDALGTSSNSKETPLATDRTKPRGRDFARQARAIADFDVAAPFGGSMDRAAAAVHAPMLVVVSPTDQVLEPEAAREFAHLANAKLVELDGKCGHGAPSCEKATLRAEIAGFLDK